MEDQQIVRHVLNISSSKMETRKTYLDGPIIHPHTKASGKC